MDIAQDKKGVILVFTLIIMSVFLSTAIGFSYFIISDINKARAIDNSIIAYYAADAAMEQSLFLLKKQNLVKSLEELKTVRGSGSLSVSAAKWYILESTDFERSFLRQRLYNGQSVKFFILNRMSGVNSSKSITVEWLKAPSTSPKLQVSLTQLAYQQQGDSLVYYTDTSEVEIADSHNNGIGVTCYNLKDVDFNGNGLSFPADYVAEIKVFGGESDFVDRLSVRSYNKRCQEEEYLKSFNPDGITNLTLKAKGQYQKSNQYIIAHIVPKDPLSGLFGFVLFSEQDITKE